MSGGKVANIYITINNQTKSISQWAKISGVSSQLIKWRFEKGWDGDEILSKPNKHISRKKLHDDEYAYEYDRKQELVHSAWGRGFVYKGTA